MNAVVRKELGKNQYIFQLKVLQDNYIYILSWGNSSLVVDPGSGEEVLALVEEERLKLKYILITHHHWDHTGGNRYLKERVNCKIIGPRDRRIPRLDCVVDDGDELHFGSFVVDVLATPGHTEPHLVYFLRNFHLLFSGDLLFYGGVGRLFEGSPERMWRSLGRVMSLPEDTTIWCGHEYTVKNLEFARHIEPNNRAVSLHLKRSKKLEREGNPTLPSLLSDEMQINPFLRSHSQSMRDALDLPGADPVTVFAHLRLLKDNF